MCKNVTVSLGKLLSWCRAVREINTPVCGKQVRQVGVRGLQVFEAKRGLRVDEQNPEWRRGYADSLLCTQRQETRAARSTITVTGNRAQRPTMQPLTCVPYVVEQHVGAGHEEEPVQGHENQTKDVESEGGADKNHADDLQTQRRLVLVDKMHCKYTLTTVKTAISVDCCARHTSMCGHSCVRMNDSVIPVVVSTFTVGPSFDTTKQNHSFLCFFCRLNLLLKDKTKILVDKWSVSLATKLTLA